MKTIKIETELTEWYIRKTVIDQMTVEELVEFSRSLGFGLSAENQRKYWQNLQKECERLLTA